MSNEDAGFRQAQHTNAELERRQQLLVDAYDEMMQETEAQVRSPHLFPRLLSSFSFSLLIPSFSRTQ